MQAYWGFCTQWVVGQLRHVRTARFPPEHEPWDLHPWNWLIALLLYCVGWVVTSVFLLLIVALKVLPILLRAVSNHVYVYSVWAPLPWKRGFKWYMGLGYFLAFPFFPVAAALLFPAMIVYGAFISAQAAVDVATYRGRIGPALGRLRDGVSMVRWAAAAKERSRCVSNPRT